MGILYRYIDWTITVPLQMVEFYLILAAVNKDISGMMFWRLLIGTVLMLTFGYAGEAKFLNPWAGFGAGMLGWFFILFEVFGGEASKVNADSANEYSRPPSTPCASLSQRAGPSTLSAI